MSALTDEMTVAIVNALGDRQGLDHYGLGCYDAGRCVDGCDYLDIAEIALAAVEPLIREREKRSRADGWDECCEAVAGALEHGPAERALPHVRTNNPYRSQP